MPGEPLPKKRLGQHFLHDPGTIERIVRAIAPAPGQRILEIGPGLGALTLPLLRAAGSLTAIELDREVLGPLAEKARSEGTLELIHGDALRIDLRALAGKGRLRVVGNLPYLVSSPILFRCLTQLDAIEDMHFMLQREVVERMTAAPGGKTFGRLSVAVQSLCHVEALFRVAPGCFRPPPKVESTFVRLVPLPPERRPEAHRETLERLLRQAFAQRRKTLANALAGLADRHLLMALGIDPARRPETIPVSDWCRLSLALHERTTTREL